MRLKALLILIAGATACAAAPAEPAGGLPHAAAPEAVGLSSATLRQIDGAVEAAIAARELPGAVVLVARRGRIAYLKAFGLRSVSPTREPMTPETVFDVASLTKVMATAPSILLLVERGALRLDDKVKRYLPKFSGGGKETINLRQLLTHYSGLRADFDLSIPWDGYQGTLDELWKESVRGETGRDFVYSDLNYIALGEVVQRVSGKPLDAFARENIFEPLGMSDTTFNPPAEWRPRIAPTESRARSLEYLKGKAPAGLSNEVLRGVVHDPTAWRMHGVAGHAGLFSSARDVAIYSQTLIDRGSHAGTRVFSPYGVAAMTSPQTPKGALVMRGFGWDIESPFSTVRGDLFTSGFGHTGFTGTSLWIHPASESFVVLLSNRVHPDGKGDVGRLRSIVSNIAAAALIGPR